MVIALDRHKKPLGVITERRARKLMKQRRACACRCMPFVLIIKDVDARDCREIPACRIRIDPGAKYTGIAIVDNSTNDFVLGFTLGH